MKIEWPFDLPNIAEICGYEGDKPIVAVFQTMKGWCVADGVSVTNICGAEIEDYLASYEHWLLDRDIELTMENSWLMFHTERNEAWIVDSYFGRVCLQNQA